MSEKQKCRVLNCIEHLLIIISTITGWVFISAFPSLVRISIEIISSATGLKICVITAETKKYKSINQTKKKKNDKIVMQAKSKLNSTDAKRMF